MFTLGERYDASTCEQRRGRAARHHVQTSNMLHAATQCRRKRWHQGSEYALVRLVTEGRTLHGEPMAPSMAQPMCKPKPMFVLKPKTPRAVRVGAT